MSWWTAILSAGSGTAQKTTEEEGIPLGCLFFYGAAVTVIRFYAKIKTNSENA